jgi:hypothetical protein
MKPEHLDWIDRIWEILGSAADASQMPKSASRSAGLNTFRTESIRTTNTPASNVSHPSQENRCRWHTRCPLFRAD